MSKIIMINYVVFIAFGFGSHQLLDVGREAQKKCGNKDKVFIVIDEKNDKQEEKRTEGLHTETLRKPAI